MNVTPSSTGSIRSAAVPVHSGIAPESAVSWAAILAGAAGAAALSLTLLILGVGLGLSSVSPWSYEGVSRETFGWATIGWISFTSIAASGLGGYLAGRLRTRWVDVHRDEAYFRDTAHGFLSWAVATILTAALLTSAIGSILGTGAKVATAGASAAATTTGLAAAGATGLSSSEAPTDQLDYWVDRLLRRDSSQTSRRDVAPAPSPESSDQTATPPSTASATETPRRRGNDLRSEIGHIVTNALAGDALDADDRQYIAQQVSEYTGLSAAEAEARVSAMDSGLRTSIEEAANTAKEAADEAREASAYASLWLFITLLMGAFVASLFATFGGRQRDQ